MRDLDARAQDLMRKIDGLADTYLHDVRSLSSDKRKEKLDAIQSLFNKAKEYGDDKVQLAIQTYELVRKIMSSFINFDIITIFFFFF